MGLHMLQHQLLNGRLVNKLIYPSIARSLPHWYFPLILPELPARLELSDPPLGF